MDAAGMMFEVWGYYTSGWGAWVSVGMYIWLALCLMAIARKKRVALWWLAPVPVGNFALMCALGKRTSGCFWALTGTTVALIAGLVFQLAVWSFVWLVLWAIAWVVAWTGIAAEMSRPRALGLLIMVPVANLVLLGVLAFGE